MLEKILGSLKQRFENSIEEVNEDNLWQKMTWNVLRCVQDGGFCFEIQETQSPFSDVQFGTFYEVAVRDQDKEYYEVLLSRYHYPGDVGETLGLHLNQPITRDGSNIHVDLSVRSNVNKIKFSPDFLVVRNSYVSNGCVGLTSEEKLNLLKVLCRAYVDVSATRRLFNQRTKEGRRVSWIKGAPVGLLDIPG